MSDTERWRRFVSGLAFFMGLLAAAAFFGFSGRADRVGEDWIFIAGCAWLAVAWATKS